jgi:signal transduction histidine kinase/HD-like signal output (HDOD) protein
MIFCKSRSASSSWFAASWKSRVFDGGSAASAASTGPHAGLGHLDSLPTLAPVVVRLLAVTSASESCAGDVAAILCNDPPLAAKVISSANSAAVGARRPVRTPEEAVVLLGFSHVRSIVFATKIIECFAGPSSGRRFQRVEFWKHCLAAACAARRLAATAPASAGIGRGGRFEFEPQEAFCAGLLHDLGKIALDAVYPKAYERVLAAAENSRADLLDCERAVLGIDHTAAGRHLAERWGLPTYLVEAAWLHHVALPDNTPRGVRNTLIRAADALAREQQIGFSGNSLRQEASADLVGRIGLDPAATADAARHLVADVAELALLLGLDRETPESLYLKSLSRANAELGRLNSELIGTNHKLAAAARYFAASAKLDELLGSRMDSADVVAAIAEAGRVALQVPAAAALAIGDDGKAIELAWRGDACGATTLVPAGTALREWISGLDGDAGALPSRVPELVRMALSPPLPELGEPWLMLAIPDGRRVLGGLIVAPQHDLRAALTDELDELRAFVRGLGLCLARAIAHAAARRLSDDLADSNRRLQGMQSELLRSRTLSSIAEMAAGAGHELNNPLSVISGRAQLLLRDAEEGSELRRALEVIHAKAHQASEIVSDLMDFARPATPRFQNVALKPLVDEIVGRFLATHALLASRIRVLPAAADWVVRADPQQLGAVLEELLNNAVEAVAENNATITIELRETQAGGARRALLTVRDGGAGMAANVMQRAFDPFFSHRRAGRGRGLGLARAHRLIEAHGGRIWLESRPHEGTAAFVELALA